MGNSLFDQLKQSGLVDEKKAKKVRHGQPKKKLKGKKGAPVPVDESKLLAQKAQAEKIERDRLLNQQKKVESDRKAIAAQIKQLIEANRVIDRDGEIVYHFTDANVVKRLYVSESIHKHLASGRIVVARFGDSYELVPRPVADKIKQRDTQCIIQCDSEDKVNDDEDDPYVDYKVPDDLMW
ncbi:MAG: nucleoprotein/polynucleotide-associated enzyme [Gammaproteobacteria bacterium]|nr:MAG: nucleoprotein/polynucleotide-associated enzyme [Gammaproteobacteria bacterium]PCH63442.1 MAG: nucleoprotein/polynucleotide-associated enzyme [Gammaproteobacteria bacterium]